VPDTQKESKKRLGNKSVVAVTRNMFF
jgi:hypothetical protein